MTQEHRAMGEEFHPSVDTDSIGLRCFEIHKHHS